MDFKEGLYPYTDELKNVMRKPTPPPAKANAFRCAMRRIYDDRTSQLVQPRELILTEENRWRSWRCNAGIESLAIRADGQVYRAECQQGGSLGNLNDRSFSFPELSVECEKNACPCIADIRVSKWYGERSVAGEPQPQL